MFKLLKKEVQYRISQSANIKSVEIENEIDLINHVIGVNNNIIDNEESGWLIVEKMLLTKKGETSIFAIRLELPIYEDNAYFNHLLLPFSSNKPVPHELLEMRGIETDINVPGTDERKESEDEKVLSTQPDVSDVDLLIQPIQQEDQKTPLKQVVTEAILTPESVTVHSTTNQPLEIRADQTEKLLASYQQKIESLESQLAEREKHETSAVGREVVSTEEVDGLTYQEMMDKYIQSELNKLAEDIKSMDNSESIFNDINDETNAKINGSVNESNTVLEAKKSSAMALAKQDYETRINDIETKFIMEKANKTKEITTAFERQAEDKIKEKISRQQEKINVAISQRKQMLLDWQENFKQSLDVSIGKLSGNTSLLSKEHQAKKIDDG